MIVIAAFGRVLRASSSRQVFPLWGPFPPIKYFSLHMKVIAPPIVTRNGTQNELIPIFMRICNSKTFNPLPSTEFLGECHQPNEQTLMENPGGSRKEPCLGFRRKNTQFFFCFSMFLRQLNGIQWH